MALICLYVIDTLWWSVAGKWSPLREQTYVRENEPKCNNRCQKNNRIYALFYETEGIATEMLFFWDFYPAIKA